MRNDTLGIPLLSSCAVHLLVILLGSVIIHNSSLRRQDFLPIGLVDVPRAENPPPLKKIEAPPEIKKPPPPLAKVEIPKEPPPVTKTIVAKPEPAAPLPAPIKEEPAKEVETKPAAPVKAESAPSFASSSHIEGGGSEAGAGNLFGKGDIGVVPGSGTAGGGGGTAASGLGRGSGARGCLLRTCCEPTVKPSRFKPCAPSTRPWRFARDLRATLR